MSKTWNQFLTEDELKLVGVVVCLDGKQRFLVIRRSDIDEREGQWTIPGGHIDDEDSSIEAGSIRELEEETGLSCHLNDLQYLGKPKPKKYYLLTQKWTGDVNVDKPNPKTGEVEHDDYKWATIDEIKEIENSEIPIYLLEEAIKMVENKKEDQKSE